MNPSFRRITADSAIDWTKVDPLIREADNLRELSRQVGIHVTTLSARRSVLGLEPLKRGRKPKPVAAKGALAVSFVFRPLAGGLAYMHTQTGYGETLEEQMIDAVLAVEKLAPTIANVYGVSTSFRLADCEA